MEFMTSDIDALEAFSLRHFHLGQGGKRREAVDLFCSAVKQNLGEGKRTYAQIQRIDRHGWLVGISARGSRIALTGDLGRYLIIDLMDERGIAASLRMDFENPDFDIAVGWVWEVWYDLRTATWHFKKYWETGIGSDLLEYYLIKLT